MPADSRGFEFRRSVLAGFRRGLWIAAQLIAGFYVWFLMVGLGLHWLPSWFYTRIESDFSPIRAKGAVVIMALLAVAHYATYKLRSLLSK